jgi:hypothetical protein
MRVAYYADDFQWYFDPLPPHALHFLTHRNEAIGNAYRPLQAAFLVLVQSRFGLDTFPIHVALVALHCGLSWLVYVWMRGRGLPVLHSALASGVMLVSQANAFAVGSNDTLSQVAGTALGCLSLWFLAEHWLPDAPAAGPRVPRALAYALSVASFGLALLFKETSAPFGAMAVLLILGRWRHRLPHRLALEALPFILVVAAYLGVRQWLGIERFAFGPERYDLNLGVFNVARNLALFAFQSVLPTSSVVAYEAFEARALARSLAIVLASLLVGAVLAMGVWRRRARPWTLVLAGFGVLALFPVVLINKVSELYVYNAMPFVSVLLGMALGDAVWQARGRRRAVWVVLLVVFFGAHAWAVHTKLALMRDCGERATAILASLEPHLAAVPPGGVLLLVNPEGEDRPAYSVFTMWGFNPIRTGTVRLEQLARRTDFHTLIVEPDRVEAEKAAARAKGQDVLAFQITREGGQLTRLDGSSAAPSGAGSNPVAGRIQGFPGR